MSYCRALCDGSTVYAYASVYGGYESWGSHGCIYDDDLESFKKTMQRYRDEGETVPDYVFERIEAELKTNPSQGTGACLERKGV